MQEYSWCCWDPADNQAVGPILHQPAWPLSTTILLQNLLRKLLLMFSVYNIKFFKHVLQIQDLILYGTRAQTLMSVVTVIH